MRKSWKLYVTSNEKRHAMSKIIIGSHVSMSGPDYYLSSVKEAISYGANTLMFYTGAPQNTLRKNTSEFNIPQAIALLEEAGFDKSKIVAHAPYIINLANTTKSATFELAVSFLKEELQRVADFSVSMVVLHPGAHVGAGDEVGINQIINGLNLVLNDDNNDVLIALETMAGKGSEVGKRFEDIAQIIAGVDKKERLGVCLDTCHINDAGYDVEDVDALLNEFDRVIGLERLKVIHINDSKNPRGARKDRHENIGYGTIGFETIKRFVHHPRLKDIPKILETPYIDKKPPYKEEIAMLKDGVYIENWRENNF